MRFVPILVTALSSAALLAACTTANSPRPQPSTSASSGASSATMRAPRPSLSIAPPSVAVLPVPPSGTLTLPAPPTTAGASANNPVQTSVLPAGQVTTLVYAGPSLPVPEALASISGKYDAVYFTQPGHPGGQVFGWSPGKSDSSELLETGATVSIQVKPLQPATLSYRLARSAP